MCTFLKRSVLAHFSLFIFGVLPVMAAESCEGIYNHQFKTLQGKAFNFCDYQDQPILVVNTASKCGFTPQFEGLERLYELYQAKGLLVVGFPSNDFKQDPAENKQIGDFCKMTYGVKFPMMEKSHVRGKEVNAFYKQLIVQSGASPKWNFYKYVIAPQGKKVTAFSSLTKPDSKALMKAIEPHLK